jgi:hypothetical protein
VLDPQCAAWSNVALGRLAWSVVSFTKATIACFAAPSFHDGSGSTGVCAPANCPQQRSSWRQKVLTDGKSRQPEQT